MQRLGVTEGCAVFQARPCWAVRSYISYLSAAAAAAVLTALERIVSCTHGRTLARKHICGCRRVPIHARTSVSPYRSNTCKRARTRACMRVHARASSRAHTCAHTRASNRRISDQYSSLHVRRVTYGSSRAARWSACVVSRCGSVPRSSALRCFPHFTPEARVAQLSKRANKLVAQKLRPLTQG